MLTRVYYRYDELEEFKCGMWRIVRGEDRKQFSMAAARLMIDAQKFKSFMLRALNEWPKSCAHNLTCEGMNRIAWLGHAGCCLGTGSPEEATRAGWYRLNQAQMDEANRVADEVLQYWHSDPQLKLAL